MLNNNYSTKKREELWKELKTGIIEMEHYKISKLINDLAVLKNRSS